MAIYTLECGVRMIHCGMAFFRSAARIFDLVVVVVSVFDAWILSPLGTTTNLNLVKLLRIVRLVRIIRLVRVVRVLKELMEVMRALRVSASVLGWTFFLLVLLTFVYAICVKLVVDLTITDTDSTVYKKYFGSNLGTSLTLFQLMTFSDGHEHIVRPLLNFSSYPTVPYLSINLYVVVMRFGLIMTAIGVLVMNVHENEKLRVSQRLESSLDKSKKLIEEISSVFTSPNKTIGIESFLYAWNHPVIISKLRLLELNHVQPTYLFCLLDADRKGFLTVSELIERLLKVKRGTPLLPMRILSDQLGKVNNALDQIERRMSSITVNPGFESLTELEKKCLEILSSTEDEIVRQRLSRHIHKHDQR